MGVLGIPVPYFDQWQILIALAGLGTLTAFLAPSSVRRPQQFSSTWTIFFFAGVVLLPSVFFLLLVILALLIQWVRERTEDAPGHFDWYIRTFGAETHAVAGLFSGTVYSAINPDQSELISGVALIGAAAAVFVYLATSQALDGVIVILTRSAGPRKNQVVSLRTLFDDTVLLIIGYLVAILWKINPWLAPLALVQILFIYWMLEIPQLRRQARIDDKTGLWNASHFRTTFTAEMNRARRLGHHLSVIMGDLDWMREINNTYGHLAGDAVLAKIGQTIRTAVREYDIAARFGGEEFVIVLPETEVAEAYAIAERLRVIIANTRFEVPTSKEPVRATMSFGLASFPWAGFSTDGLLHSADVALYHAKERGRNRVEVFSETLDSVWIEGAREVAGSSTQASNSATSGSLKGRNSARDN